MNVLPSIKQLGAIKALLAFTALVTVGSMVVTWFAMTLSGHSMSRLAWLLASALPLILTPVIAYKVITLVFRLAGMEERMRQVFRTDSVTETLSRSSFLEQAEACFSRGKKGRLPVSAVILNIDPLRKMNNEHGTLVGDQVLRAVARTCRGIVNPDCLLARYGSEGLAFYLPNTDHATCQTFTEKLRERIALTTVAHGRMLLRLTVTIGSVSGDAQRYPETVHALMAGAEAALSLARAGGNNRVEALPPQAFLRNDSGMGYALGSSAVGAVM